MPDYSVVDNHVGIAECLSRKCHQSLDPGEFRQIGLAISHPRAVSALQGVARGFDRFRLLDAVEHDIVASRSQALSDRIAKAAARSRDQRRTA